jgi:hypothetical protein
MELRMKLMPIHWSYLERKRVYIVVTKCGIYKGMYLTQPRSNNFIYIILSHVSVHKRGNLYLLPDALFNREDTYYDAEDYINKIKQNAINARQQMETRSLKIILHKLVNETFEW